jgi:hypothetical protein
VQNYAGISPGAAAVLHLADARRFPLDLQGRPALPARGPARKRKTVKKKRKGR